jgi:uncharacterized protein YbjT (DUF2867 family)
MAYRHILILGGGGFIGTHLTSYLAQNDDCHITVATRRYEHVTHLRNLPRVGLFAGDIHQANVLDVLVRDVDVVINLVGTLYSGRPNRTHVYGREFTNAHVQLTRNILAACDQHGVKRYIQMSAIGVDDQEANAFLQSKSAAEAIALNYPDIHTTVLRTSIVFGPGDRFLTLLARLQKQQFKLPVTEANAQFQPVFVGDVVQMIVYALKTDATIGQILTLIGKQAYTLRELYSLTGDYSGHSKTLSEWNPKMAFWKRFFYPGQLLQKGDLGLMQLANRTPTSEEQADQLARRMQIRLKTIEEVAPTYLARCLQNS